MTIEECKQKLSVGNKLEIKNPKVFPGEILFNLYDEKGLPLMFSLSFIIDKKYVVNWSSFIDSAADHGWSPKKIYNTITHGCSDAGYNKKYFRTYFEYKEIK